MNRYRETALALFARFAYGLGGKPRPAVLPLSKSLGHPATQTSPIFKLPDELILSILSYISPDPQTIGHCARYRAQYRLVINDHHERRVQFLLQLSMTCRMMRLRLLPWIWGRLEFPVEIPKWTSDGRFLMNSAGRLNAIVNALRADVPLGTNVKFMAVCLMWPDFNLSLFVKCLKFLPNLHTLEIGRAYSCTTIPLENALKRIKLPQIKALTLPAATYPLLRHCRDVEDVVCVVLDGAILYDEFLGTLASNQESKVKRLAIPLISWDNPFRYLTALPKLIELTVLYPHPYGARPTKNGFQVNVVGTVRSAMLELVNACRALPDFCTLQIVHFPLDTPSLRHTDRWEGVKDLSSVERREQALREEVNDVKHWAIECLKANMEYREGGGKKKTVLRVIELNTRRSDPKYCLDSVKVEECEVYGSDST